VNELDLFAASVRWAKVRGNTPEAQRAALGSLLGLIRFHALTAQQFGDVVCNYKLLTAEEESAIFRVITGSGTMPAGFSNECKSRDVPGGPFLQTILNDHKNQLQSQTLGNNSTRNMPFEKCAAVKNIPPFRVSNEPNSFTKKFQNVESCPQATNCNQTPRPTAYPTAIVSPLGRNEMSATHLQNIRTHPQPGTSHERGESYITMETPTTNTANKSAPHDRLKGFSYTAGSSVIPNPPAPPPQISKPLSGPIIKTQITASKTNTNIINSSNHLQPTKIFKTNFPHIDDKSQNNATISSVSSNHKPQLSRSISEHKTKMQAISADVLLSPLLQKQTLKHSASMPDTKMAQVPRTFGNNNENVGTHIDDSNTYDQPYEEIEAISNEPFGVYENIGAEIDSRNKLDLKNILTAPNLNYQPMTKRRDAGASLPGQDFKPHLMALKNDNVCTGSNNIKFGDEEFFYIHGAKEGILQYAHDVVGAALRFSINSSAFLLSLKINATRNTHEDYYNEKLVVVLRRPDGGNHASVNFKGRVRRCETFSVEFNPPCALTSNTSYDIIVHYGELNTEYTSYKVSKGKHRSRSGLEIQIEEEGRTQIRSFQLGGHQIYAALKS
jgi:hypothetical protein